MHFIPPASPPLNRTVGEATLTYEELTTLTYQKEAYLKSRSLCPLSEDIIDTTTLTSGHLLIGRDTSITNIATR